MEKAVTKNETLQIGTFLPEKIRNNASILVIGKRLSGKTTLVCDILNKFYFQNSTSNGLVIAPTDVTNKFYSQNLPSDASIYYELTTSTCEIIQNALEKQEKSYVIMDDCLCQKANWEKDKTIYGLLCNGRHHNLTSVLTMQYPLNVPPEIRQNFDYVFLLFDDVIENQKKIYEYYAGCFPNFESFSKVFNQLTTDYGCMVLVNIGSRANIGEKVFSYKAQQLNNDHP